MSVTSSLDLYYFDNLITLFINYCKPQNSPIHHHDNPTVIKHLLQTDIRTEVQIVKCVCDCGSRLISVSAMKNKAFAYTLAAFVAFL